MKVDLETGKGSKKGAGSERKAELALVQEHIEERKRNELFGQFCDPRSDDELYLLQKEAKRKPSSV